jgi:hypothetical protein
MSICVILDLGTEKIVVKKDNFSSVIYNRAGSVHSFVKGDKLYISCVKKDVFFGFLESVNFNKQNERYYNKVKKERVTDADWRLGEFNSFSSLAVAENGDILEGAFFIFNNDGRCGQLYHYTYNGIIPTEVQFKQTTSGPPFDCENFGGTGTHAGKFFNDYKDVSFYDVNTGMSSTDINLVGEIALLLKNAGEQTAIAFEGFVLNNVNTQIFTFYDNGGNYTKGDFINYKLALKKWLKMLEDYKKKIKDLSDDEKLFIYVDVLYRHNMLAALTVDQKIKILKAMVQGSLISWYFASWKTGFQNRELLALIVVKSITQSEASDFLNELISNTIIWRTFPELKITLYKALFYRIDDFFGEDRFTEFAKEINRIVLAKNGIIQSSSGIVINDPNQLKPINDYVKYNFIWNEKANKDFVGEIEYSVTYPTNEKIKIKEKVCTGIRYTYPYADQFSQGPAVPTPSVYQENEVLLHHFDLISVTFLSNPSFLDLCQYENCTNATFLASAGYIDYLLEKQDTKFTIDVLTTSLQVLSLAFGVGELLVAVRTANLIRGIVGGYVVLGDVYSLVISSASFNEYLEEAFPDTYQDIKQTLDMISLIHGLTSAGVSIGYSAYNVSQVNKFIGEVDALYLNPGAIARLNSAEINALQETRKRLLVEIAILRRNAATNQIIENEIRYYRDLRNLQIPNCVRGSQSEWNTARQAILDHRILVSTPNSRNFGFIEGNVNGVISSSLLDSQTGYNVWRSVSEQIASLEDKIYTASIVGNHSRITDSEFRMINKLALTLKPNAQLGDIYTDVTGNLKIVSENIYCSSCQDVIKQFNQMFPNVDIKLIDATRVGY